MTQNVQRLKHTHTYAALSLQCVCVMQKMKKYYFYGRFYYFILVYGRSFLKFTKFNNISCIFRLHFSRPIFVAIRFKDKCLKYFKIWNLIHIHCQQCLQKSKGNGKKDGMLACNFFVALRIATQLNTASRIICLILNCVQLTYPSARLTFIAIFSASYLNMSKSVLCFIFIFIFSVTLLFVSKSCTLFAVSHAI